jgi:hypothetical protein
MTHGYRFMPHAATLTACVVLVSGCVTDPGLTGVPGVREVPAAEAASCAYVADIRSTPGVYGPLAAQGVAYARNRILADARDAGANTVVFEQVSPGTDIYELRATAYRC